MALLSHGQRLQTGQSPEGVEVLELLGEGAQGEVYRATMGGADYALKWYFPHAIKDDLGPRVARLVEIGPPGPCFVWPVASVTDMSGRGFGYLMPLKPAALKSITHLMSRSVEPSFRALLEGCRQLATSFLELHTLGLCYRDISFENICMNPQTGDVRILDNDNVDVDGKPGEIDGTPRFMAPEIVVGKSPPTSRTDRFSLSVLLFYMTMFHHPLEGAEEARIHALDWPAMRHLYGAQPVFIFDPQNHVNRPVPGLHDNAIQIWPLYPEILRATFTRCFTVGLHDQDARVPSSEWRYVLSAVMDAILYCQCGAENFYDSATVSADNTTGKPCWRCAATVALPPRIRIRSHIVMLNHDSKLYRHHLDESHLYDFTAPVAEVSRHPVKQDLWGLKNLSGSTWVCTPLNGTPVEVPSGRSVGLASGCKINFGTSLGEIRM